MYTQKHFEEMAAVLAKNAPQAYTDASTQHWKMTKDICEMFADSNPKFDQERFIMALLNRMDDKQKTCFSQAVEGVPIQSEIDKNVEEITKMISSMAVPMGVIKPGMMVKTMKP